jgi:PAS domain S-box-containing protein
MPLGATRVQPVLRVLQVTDSEADAAEIAARLEVAGYAVRYARTMEAGTLRALLSREKWDVVVAAHQLSQFDAPAALRTLRESGQDIPFIVVSAPLGEDLAVEMMRNGAHDYVLKDELTRLVPAVEREIREAQTRRERREAQEKLHNSEERLALIINATQFGAFDYDPRTGELIWSEFAKRHFGLPPDAPVDYPTFLRGLHPDDRDRVDRTVQRVLQAGSGGEYSTEYRTIGLQDGIERWLMAWGRVFFDGSGKPLRFVGGTLDITDRKRSEQALRLSSEREKARASELEAVMDAVPVAIFMSRDPDCRTILGSRMTYELLRLPPGTNLSFSAGAPQRPSSFRIIKDGLEVQAEDMPVQRAAFTGQPVKNFEFDIVLNDGSRRRMLGNAVPMLGEDGVSHGAVGGFLDVTERKQMEERLLQAQKAESVGLLAGGVAHDFNNILTAITGNISLALLETAEGSRPWSALMRANESVARAAGLTRQLLAYAGKGAFVRERVSVSAVVRETAQLLRASLPKKAELLTDLAEDLPPVMMDPGHMQQILTNLIVNSAEAIGEMRGTVTVRTGRRGNRVLVEVSDNGCGMDPATLNRIFDPFFTTKFLGRGLGLAAVQGIVRSLNGEIGVESVPGHGTTVRVLLPAAVEPGSIRTGVVLVVEDEVPGPCFNHRLVAEPRHRRHRSLQRARGGQHSEVARRRDQGRASRHDDARIERRPGASQAAGTAAGPSGDHHQRL